MESNQPVMPSSPAPASGGNERMMAVGSLVLGVITMCAWFLPICGIPLSIFGIVLGFFGMKDQTQKTLAIIGLALCAFSLLLGCGNAAYGAYLGFTGQSNFNFGP